MNDPFILSATLRQFGPELSVLGGEQIELSLYVVYEDGSDATLKIHGKNLPEFIRNVRSFDMRKTGVGSIE